MNVSTFSGLQPTHTHVRGNPADVDVCAVGLLDELGQPRLAQLRVVEEGGVGVHVRVDSLVHNVPLGVELNAFREEKEVKKCTTLHTFKS